MGSDRRDILLRMTTGSMVSGAALLVAASDEEETPMPDQAPTDRQRLVERADKLLIDFYCGKTYDPKAPPADNVKAAITLALTADAKRIEDLEAGLRDVLASSGARGHYHALKYADAVAAAERLLPCETRGAEDMEAGCCSPCRARALIGDRHAG